MSQHAVNVHCRVLIDVHELEGRTAHVALFRHETELFVALSMFLCMCSSQSALNVDVDLDLDFLFFFLGLPLLGKLVGATLAIFIVASFLALVHGVLLVRSDHI